MLHSLLNAVFTASISSCGASLALKMGFKHLQSACLQHFLNNEAFMCLYWCLSSSRSAYYNAGSISESACLIPDFSSQHSINVLSIVLL